MTRIRWYLDEDAMTRALVRGLEARGIDVLTTFDAGMIGSEDAEQLAFASEQGWVLFTFNVVHFCRLHAECLSAGRQHAGIVVAHRKKLTLGEQVHGLARLTSTVPAEAMVAQLVFLKV